MQVTYDDPEGRKEKAKLLARIERCKDVSYTNVFADSEPNNTVLTPYVHEHSVCT